MLYLVCVCEIHFGANHCNLKVIMHPSGKNNCVLIIVHEYRIFKNLVVMQQRTGNCFDLTKVLVEKICAVGKIIAILLWCDYQLSFESFVLHCISFGGHTPPPPQKKKKKKGKLPIEEK